MKFIVAALALVCVNAAEDSAPPAISLDLAALPHAVRSNYYAQVAAGHALHAHAQSSQSNGHNVYARQCNVGVDNKDTCKGTVRFLS